MTIDDDELTRLFGSRWISIAGLKRIEEESGRRYKKGKFTEPELVVLRQGVADLLSEKGVSQERFLETFFFQKGRSKQVYRDESGQFGDFFVRLAQKLPGRPVINVYHCLRRLYHPGNRKGRWSEDDDRQLRNLFNTHGPDWAQIGLELGRSGMSCRDRFRQTRTAVNKGFWSDTEIEALRQAVEDLTPKEGTPVWELVAERVATRSSLQCIIKWGQLQTAAANNASHRPPFARGDDLELVERIQGLGVSHETEISWRDLASAPFKSGTVFDREMLRRRWNVLKKRLSGKPSIEQAARQLAEDLQPITTDYITTSDEEEVR